MLIQFIGSNKTDDQGVQELWKQKHVWLEQGIKRIILIWFILVFWYKVTCNILWTLFILHKYNFWNILRYGKKVLKPAVSTGSVIDFYVSLIIYGSGINI